MTSMSDKKYPLPWKKKKKSLWQTGSKIGPSDLHLLQFMPCVVSFPWESPGLATSFQSIEYHKDDGVALP